MTTKVRALSLVAGHLGTDLTLLRADGRRLRWLGFSGGDHIIQDWRGRQFHVDLVVSTVVQRAGIPFQPEVSP